MTLKRLMTTVVVATPVGSPPPYAKLGQGVMGGTIAALAEGDAVDAKFQLEELQHVFQREFDRGDLTVGALKLDLWQAHWYRASRQAMQRAADMLVVASASGIPSTGKLARECEGLAKVLDLFVNAKPADHPIGDALLRGEPIPASDGVRRQELETSALRVDGIRPTALLTSEESQALAEQISSTADAVRALGVELAGIEVNSADDAGSTAGAEDSPFAVYEFPHEMYAALRRVSETVGGIREVEKQGLAPTPEMLKVRAKVLSDVDELLGRIDGTSFTYRPTVLTDKKMVEEAMRYRDEQARQAQAEEVLRKLDELHTHTVNDRHASKVSAIRSLQELERIERGLMALAKAIGPVATEQTLAAMERPA